MTDPTPPPSDMGATPRTSEAELRDHWETVLRTYQSTSGRAQIAVEVAHRLYTTQCDLDMANFIISESKRERDRL